MSPRVLVSGGSRGIGRAIVERLAHDGGRVVLGHGSRNGAAEEVVASVRREGGECWAAQADLAAPGGGTQLFDAAEEILGGVDVLVSNAATGLSARLEDTTDADLDRLLAVNTRAAFELLRAASARMPDGGRVVAVSSTNTAHPVEGVGAYAASKAAVEQLSAVAARELGSRRITVNCVSPGPTGTALLDTMSTPEVREEAIPAMTPLGRLGHPDDVAGVVAFLVGPDGAWVTGQNIRASGGLV